jgi:predicted dehydrogenase
VTPATHAPRRYRGALVGLGNVARQAHLPALLGDRAVRERLELVVAVDPAPDVAAPDGVPLVRDRAALAALDRALAGSPPLDFVIVTTPTATHVDQVLWALGEGYHVLCEKPVATTAADAARIAAAARRAGRVVMPCHQYRFNPAWRQLRAWLDGGAIGRWHLAEFRVFRPAADRGSASGGTPWRGTRAASGGGVLLDHGAHLMYQLLDAVGTPRAVRAWTGRLRHADYDVEDSAHVLFEYPAAAASLFLTWAGRGRETQVRFVGEAGAVEWTGGVLRLETDRGCETIDHTAALDKSAYAAWFAALFGEFAAAMDHCDGGAAVREAHLDDVRRVAELLEASYAAARTARRVRLQGASGGRRTTRTAVP